MTLEDFKFEIEIVSNTKQVDFLTLSFDLQLVTSRYKKPNDETLFVQLVCIHPPV